MSATIDAATLARLARHPDPKVREVVAERVRREKLARSTLAVAEWRSPEFRASSSGMHAHLAGWCDVVVDSVVAGRGEWVFAHAPPGHGKSELIGRCMPVRLALARPGSRILYVTSTDDRAQEVSAAVRSCMERLHRMGHEGKAPGRVWRTTEWECVDGTSWVGLGAGAATGGVRADLIIPDDVTGSGERAGSEAWRRHAERWLEEDVLSRGFGVRTAVFGMETRRGPKDLRAWAESRYGAQLRTVDIECCATRDEPWRKMGDYAWPERYGADWRARMPHLVHGGRVWETLYQGHPTATQGEIIKRTWFDDHRYKDDPRDLLTRARRLVIAIDCAASPDSKADHTVMQVWADIGGTYYLLDERRGQWGITEQEAALYALVEAWPHRARAVVIEHSSNGIALHQRVGPKLGSIPASTATKRHDDGTASTAKERRAYEFIAAAQAGRVCVMVGPKGDAVIDEWVSLGLDAPDDRLDAAAHAVNHFAGGAIPQGRAVSLGL